MPDSTSDIADFASNVLGRPLYPYQAEIAAAVLASIRGGHGRIFTVMMARQSGKNQLSAVIEAYLLATLPAGTIIKAAPTFNPQIANSRERLRMLLNASDLQERVWSNRTTLGLANSADPAQVRRHLGPRVVFYSASPQSNVVGATADLLLEIDEAQDVAIEKFNRDFRPMAAVKNATQSIVHLSHHVTDLQSDHALALSGNLASRQRAVRFPVRIPAWSAQVHRLDRPSFGNSC